MVRGENSEVNGKNLGPLATKNMRRAQDYEAAATLPMEMMLRYHGYSSDLEHRRQSIAIGHVVYFVDLTFLDTSLGTIFFGST